MSYAALEGGLVSEAERAPLADVAQGKEFYIAVAKARDFCLAVGMIEIDPSKVKLSRVRNDSRCKWTLVHGDTFRNVHTGHFLDTDTMYAFVRDVSEIWSGNHTSLYTRPQNFSASQRWVMGPEEYHGGKVLRHFLDGRGVDVHGWSFKHGGNVGVENSVHHTCDGISYVLTLCENAAIPEQTVVEKEAERMEEATRIRDAEEKEKREACISYIERERPEDALEQAINASLGGTAIANEAEDKELQHAMLASLGHEVTLDSKATMLHACVEMGISEEEARAALDATNWHSVEEALAVLL